MYPPLPGRRDCHTINLPLARALARGERPPTRPAPVEWGRFADFPHQPPSQGGTLARFDYLPYSGILLPRNKVWRTLQHVESCHKMRQICFYTFRRGAYALCLISFIIMYSMDMVNKLPILNKTSHAPPGCPFGTCSISFTYKDFSPLKWQKKIGGLEGVLYLCGGKAKKTYHYGTKIHSNA